MSTSSRSHAQILAELGEVRRHLRDAPPHHGQGVRDALEQRLRRLERELAAGRDGHGDSGPAR